MTRKKNKTISICVDPKYADKLAYIKYNGSITAFFESCLDKLEVDPKVMEMVKRAEAAVAEVYAGKKTKSDNVKEA